MSANELVEGDRSQEITRKPSAEKGVWGDFSWVCLCSCMCERECVVCYCRFDRYVGFQVGRITVRYPRKDDQSDGRKTLQPNRDGACQKGTWTRCWVYCQLSCQCHGCCCKRREDRRQTANAQCDCSYFFSLFLKLGGGSFASVLIVSFGAQGGFWRKVDTFSGRSQRAGHYLAILRVETLEEEIARRGGLEGTWVRK